MFLNFLLFFLSIFTLVGSAISSMMASYTIAIVASLCMASLIAMLSIGYISHRVIVGYTLMHLAQCSRERVEAQEQQLQQQGPGSGSGNLPATSSQQAKQPAAGGAAVRGVPAIEEGSWGRGARVAPE